MANLTKSTFVYNGTNPLVLCQRIMVSTSPPISATTLTSGFTKSPKNRIKTQRD